MAYIGNQPNIGNWRKLDDISGSFNGVTTSFTTSVDGENVTAASANQLFISLGGVIQEPGVNFTITTNTIIFTTAPASGLSFFGVYAGDSLNVAGPSDGTVDTSALQDGAVTSAKILDGTIVDADINASAAIAGSKIQAASTSNVGAVQLTDSTSSTSTTTAATPNSVKSSYDLANAALPKTGGIVTGDVTLDNQSDLRFREATANGTNYVGFQAPASISSDLIWTLPASDGTSGQVLQTNGSGTLSFATPSGGKILQVVSGTTTGQTTTTSTSFAATDLFASIIPTSTSSRIFISAFFNVEVPPSSNSGKFTLYRNLINLGVTGGYLAGLQAGSNTLRQSVTLNCIDSPNTTSSITYRVYCGLQIGGSTLRFNYDISSNAGGPMDATITLFEVGA